jgi:hypothetical protein
MSLSDVTPEQLSLTVLLSGISFSALWYLDHRTHERIWENEISDGELRTHRMILYASWVLLGSLVLMAWWPGIALPMFIGAFVTRTLHEGIDELRWHVRCTERETLIHLGMWICVHTGTAAMFLWAWVHRYAGLADLPLWIWIGYGVILVAISAIGHREVVGYRTRTQPRAARAVESLGGELS